MFYQVLFCHHFQTPLGASITILIICSGALCLSVFNYQFRIKSFSHQYTSLLNPCDRGQYGIFYPSSTFFKEPLVAFVMILLICNTNLNEVSQTPEI